MTQENISRATRSSHRLTGTKDWARGRAMYERFTHHLLTGHVRSETWDSLLVEEQIAWRELAKMYRVCVYNKKGVKV